MSAPPGSPPLDQLPVAPASSVKDGWRGMMRALSAEGRLLITNHNQPEAVILSTAEYARLLEAARAANRPCPTRWPNCAAASTNGWRRWTMNRPATACAT